MIQTHQLNLEASQWLLRRCEDDMQPKACYNNIADAVVAIGDELRELDWCIGMGYVAPKGSFYVRHAFFLDRKGKSVDPTLLLVRTPEELLGGSYITFATFTVDEYLEALFKNNREPSLYRVCAKAEMDAHEWARKNNHILLG